MFRRGNARRQQAQTVQADDGAGPEIKRSDRVQTVPGWQQHIVYTFLGRRPAGQFVVVGDRPAMVQPRSQQF